MQRNLPWILFPRWEYNSFKTKRSFPTHVQSLQLLGGNIKKKTDLWITLHYNTWDRKFLQHIYYLLEGKLVLKRGCGGTPRIFKKVCRNVVIKWQRSDPIGYRRMPFFTSRQVYGRFNTTAPWYSLLGHDLRSFEHKKW